jgi:hypothetical protein
MVRIAWIRVALIRVAFAQSGVAQSKRLRVKLLLPAHKRPQRVGCTYPVGSVLERHLHSEPGSELDPSRLDASGPGSGNGSSESLGLALKSASAGTSFQDILGYIWLPLSSRSV